MAAIDSSAATLTEQVAECKGGSAGFRTAIVVDPAVSAQGIACAQTKRGTIFTWITTTGALVSRTGLTTTTDGVDAGKRDVD